MAKNSGDSVVIALSFFMIALLYSAVGFGGGSSYIAILALSDYPYQSIPILALICNLIVVSSGVALFYLRGHLNWRLFWPFAASSIPMAYIGGRMLVSKEVFLTTLAGCLALVGMRILFSDFIDAEYQDPRKQNLLACFVIGAVLGLLSGIVGIGGGIFLVPTLLILRWGTPKNIAASAALFIFLNSVAGLVGQLSKGVADIGWSQNAWLFGAVFFGGQLGSRFGAGIASQRLVKNLTACLVIFVSVRLLMV